MSTPRDPDPGAVQASETPQETSAADQGAETSAADAAPAQDPAATHLEALERENQELATRATRGDSYDAFFKAYPQAHQALLEIADGNQPTAQAATPADPRASLPEDRNDWERKHWEIHEQALVSDIEARVDDKVTKATGQVRREVAEQANHEILRGRTGLTYDAYKDAYAKVQGMPPLEQAELLVRRAAGLDIVERAEAAAQAAQAGTPLAQVNGTNGAPVARLTEVANPNATGLPGPAMAEQGPGQVNLTDTQIRARAMFAEMYGPNKADQQYAEMTGRRVIREE